MIDKQELDQLKKMCQGSNWDQRHALYQHGYFPETAKKKKVFSNSKISVVLHWEEASKGRYPLGRLYFKITCQGQKNQAPVSIEICEHTVFAMGEFLYRLQTEGVKGIVLSELKRNAIERYNATTSPIERPVYKTHAEREIAARQRMRYGPKARKQVIAEEVKKYSNDFETCTDSRCICCLPFYFQNWNGGRLINNMGYCLSIFYQSATKGGAKKIEPYRVLLEKESSQKDRWGKVIHGPTHFAHVQLTECELEAMITSIWENYKRCVSEKNK